MSVSMNYGRAVRIVRSARKLTQSQVAESSGLSPAYISLVESGDRQPSIKALKSLCGALRVPMHLLALLASSSSEIHGLSESETNRLGRGLLEFLISDEALE